MPVPNASRSDGAPVVLSREQRDALHKEMRRLLTALSDVENCLRDGDVEDGRDAWEWCRLAMRLLDDLGWEHRGRDERYVLTVPAEQLEPWARRHIDQVSRCLQDEAEELAIFNAGEDPWGKYRHLTPSSLDEDARDLHVQLDEDLEALAAYRSILDQLEAS